MNLKEMWIAVAVFAALWAVPVPRLHLKHAHQKL
jgi:hypothetical protein